MNNKAIYRRLCEQEKTIPVFSQPWWLDSVCGQDNWDVCLVEKNNQVLASMPYYLKKRYGFTWLSMPPLTQTLGPWIKSSEAIGSQLLAKQKDLMEGLIEQLPSYDCFHQNWHYSNTNWLPFYWKGFQQTTRYTYVIDDLTNLDKVYSGFEHSKRKNIKKSEKIVRVVFNISKDEFYENHKMTLAKQGSKISYSENFFYRIYESGYARNSAATIGAYDDKGNLHAALFVIWDEVSAYDLISTIDPDFRTYGAASLLIKEIIKFVADKTTKFDFEGSMIEPVEKSFRQFGAKQIPYYSIKKTPSRLLQFRHALLCLGKTR